MSRALAPDVGFRRLLLLTLAAAGCSGKAPVEPSGSVQAAPVTVDGTEVVQAPEVTEPSDASPLPEGGDPPPSADAPGSTSAPDPQLDCSGPLFATGSLQPAQEVDGIVLHQRHEGRRPASNMPLVAQSGEFCAADGDACQTSAEALWQSPAIRSDCGQIGCTRFHLAYSTGNTVNTVPSAEDLPAFLGTIDTAAEARLIAWAARFDVLCTPTADGDGWSVVATQFVRDCPMQTDQVLLTVSATGAISETSRVEGLPGPCAGRVPPGLCSAPLRDQTVGEWLASAAHMEAASVHAFEVLVLELLAHNAPESLIEAARNNAADERRHALVMGDLARARGVEVVPVVVEPVAIRSLAELAQDNAAEGLGREAWGALLALWQAQNATDPEIRAAMASIAWDEVRHAEFSRALQAWLAPQLNALERSHTQAAEQAAWASLAVSAGRGWAPEVAEALGMPHDPVHLLAASRVAGIAA